MSIAITAGQFNDSKYAGDDAAQEETVSNYREKIRLAKQAKEKEEQVKSSASNISAAKFATNRALAFAWLNLIPSFGLTLLYINLHVFMHAIMPSVFGKLGEEWVPKQASIVAGNLDSATKKVGLVETMLLVMLDLFMITSIILAISFVMMIIDYASSVFSQAMLWWNT